MKKAAVASMHFLVFLAALLALWEYVRRSGRVPRVLLPGPADVLSYLRSATTGDGVLPTAVLVTLGRLLAGYCFSLVFGVLLGLACAASPFVRHGLGTMALGLQTLPSICWAPLALLWFGQSGSALLFVIVMGSIWSILLSTCHGARTVHPSYVQTARTLGSTGAHTWLTVVFPAAFPQWLAGFKQSWAFAWRSLMSAEIYVAVTSGFGLGQLLHYGRELHAMDQVLGIIIVIIALGLLIDRLAFAPLERMVRRRWGLSS